MCVLICHDFIRSPNLIKSLLKIMTKRIAAMLKNDLGQLLPYTCQSTMSGCEEWCSENIANFPKVLELGGKIVQVEITELGE